MSIRTNVPRSAIAVRFARQSTGSTSSPRPVSFTLTFASSPSASIASSTSRYARVIARASSGM